MIKHKDFKTLGFINLTVPNDDDIEQTVLVYEIEKRGGYLLFTLYPNDELWHISEGREFYTKLYAKAYIKTPEHLESLTRLYLAQSARLAEEKDAD